MGNSRTHADSSDSCTGPEEHKRAKLSIPLPSNEGIPLQLLDARPADLGRIEYHGQEEVNTSHEPNMRSKITDHVRRWSKSLDEGLRSLDEELRSRGNDIIVMVFEVQKLSWIEKHFTFYRIHATYFILLGTLGTLVIFMLPLSDSRQLDFVDAIYTSFSVLCGVGFQTVRAADLTYFHIFVIWFLMGMGAPVLLSLLPLYIRRVYFYLCIRQNTEHVYDREPPDSCTRCIAKTLKPSKISHDGETEVVSSGGHPQQYDVNHHLSPAQSMETNASQVKSVGISRAQSLQEEDEKRIFRMCVDKREALRTVEYRALVVISRVVLCYYFGVQIIGFIMGAQLLRFPNAGEIVKSKGINPTFYAFYTSTAAFSNSGYYLTNDSMIAFQKSSFLLILYTILPLLGNTLYPPALRLMVWIHHIAAAEMEKPVYEYLLQYPRRCFTSLFPRSQTMWLIVAFLAFTSIQLIFLCSLEWHNAFAGMNTIQKLVAGVYQAVGTRSSGGEVVDLYRLAPAILFLFSVMMYISAYPIFLSLQTSNKNNDYDETELVASQSSKGHLEALNKWGNVIVFQSRKLLARDASYLVFAVLFLCLSESESIKQDPLNFSIFSIVFEVISAYAGIGLSIGYHCELRLDKTTPCEEVPYSFSGTWTSTGKLILVVVMLRGRHRGLPENIDSAIRLPTKPLTATLPQTSRPVNNASTLH
ncbi:unnamed protein product [Calypogeia fissa]